MLDFILSLIVIGADTTTISQRLWENNFIFNLFVGLRVNVHICCMLFAMFSQLSRIIDNVVYLYLKALLIYYRQKNGVPYETYLLDLRNRVKNCGFADSDRIYRNIIVIEKIQYKKLLEAKQSNWNSTSLRISRQGCYW